MQDFLNDIKWAKTVVEAYKVNNVLKLFLSRRKSFKMATEWQDFHLMFYFRI